MIYEIESYIGAGPVRLGMTREEIRHALGVPVEEHRKTQWDELLDDVFGSLGIVVAYRKPGVCEFIEFGGIVFPTLKGESFLGRPYRDVQRWFEAHDPMISLDGTGLISLAFGVTIFASGAVKAPDEPVESVGIFEREYFGALRQSTD